MRRIRSSRVVTLTFLLMIAGGGFAALVTPAPGSVHAAVYEGLVLLRDGQFDPWISQYCDPGELCFNENATASLKKYNLPAIQRLAPNCLKGSQLDVTKVQEDGAKLKVFLQCSPSATPKPFYMKKVGSAWKFYKI